MPPPTTGAQLRSIWAPGTSAPRRRPPVKAKAQLRKKKRFDPVKHNAAFVACYRGQIVADSEWDAFLTCLRLPLPTTFSFVETGDAEVRPTIVQPRLEAMLMRLGDVQGDDTLPAEGPVRVASGSHTYVRLALDRAGGVRAFLSVESVAAPRHARQLPWFPGGRGWQFDSPRKELVANRHLCRELRQYLETHTQSGRVNRQEAVSMLPPLLLQVRPGHAVLDLCAAPGSKTVLLLSQLSTLQAAAAAGASSGGNVGRLGTGCVVANEINPMRCNKLRVRMARTRVLGQVLACHAAQDFPGSAEYDRILCDVPCSGDGTLRKNPDIWASWQPRFSASLHPLQLSILRRGLELLRPGGLLVYSTCSFRCAPLLREIVISPS